MNRIWSYSNNSFKSATKDSFIKAVIISTFLDSSLNAAKGTSSAILALYTYYHAIHLNLKEAYDSWSAKGGQQKGDSAALVQLFNQLTAKVNAWDAAIQQVYAKGIPKYIALLPNGHEPFQQGRQETRISAISALSTNLATEPALADLKTDVDSFYTLLTGVNTSQKGIKSAVSINSDALEAFRLEMCVAQYYVLGGLMQEFAHNPEKVADFYDLENLQTRKQTIYTGTLHSTLPHHVLRHKFETGDTLRLKNDGDSELKFYLSHVKEGVASATFITVAPGTDEVYPVAGLGDIANRYLTVTGNTDNGHYEVEIL